MSELFDDTFFVRRFGPRRSKPSYRFLGLASNFFSYFDQITIGFPACRFTAGRSDLAATSLDSFLTIRKIERSSRQNRLGFFHETIQGSNTIPYLLRVRWRVHERFNDCAINTGDVAGFYLALCGIEDQNPVDGFKSLRSDFFDRRSERRPGGNLLTHGDLAKCPESLGVVEWKWSSS